MRLFFVFCLGLLVTKMRSLDHASWWVGEKIGLKCATERTRPASAMAEGAVPSSLANVLVAMSRIFMVPGESFLVPFPFAILLYFCPSCADHLHPSLFCRTSPFSWFEGSLTHQIRSAETHTPSEHPREDHLLCGWLSGEKHYFFRRGAIANGGQ